MSYFEDSEAIRSRLNANRTGVALVKDLLTGDFDHAVALVAQLNHMEMMDALLAVAGQAAGYLTALEEAADVDAAEYLSGWAVRLAAMDGPEIPGRLP